jgi:aryl sulfotransferase
VKPRLDDIIIATAYKSGTTWMQQIMSEILFQGQAKPASVADMSPWVDLRVPPAEVLCPAIEGQTWRRFLKTHLPADAFEPYFNTSAKYIYVGRDGRDAFMSLMNHWEKANDVWYGAMNEAPGRVGPPIPKFSEAGSVSEIFDRWLSEGWPTLPNESDGWPFWSLFHNTATWWAKGQANSNILFVHFNDLKADLQGEMVRIAKFLEVDVDESRLPDMVKACTFDEMKRGADKIAPLNGQLWQGGGNDFIFKGTNQRWKGVLSDSQLAAYEEKVKKALTPDCAKWLEGGSGKAAA